MNTRHAAPGRIELDPSAWIGQHVDYLYRYALSRLRNSEAAEEMVSGIKESAKDWKYEVVSIGYPGLAIRDRVVSEPHNLAPGWVGFDFPSAFAASLISLTGHLKTLDDQGGHRRGRAGARPQHGALLAFQFAGRGGVRRQAALRDAI